MVSPYERFGLQTQPDGISAHESEPKIFGIQFERFLPHKMLSVPDLLPDYLPPDKLSSSYDFRAKLGPSILYEANPETETYVAEALAQRLVARTGQLPDIVVVSSSHLPPYDPGNPDSQRRANHVRHALSLPEDSATPDNTQTISTACSGSVVGFDWVRQHAKPRQNVLMVMEETGYRRTLPPPHEDRGKSGLLFSDAAIAMQFTNGEDLTVVSSVPPQYEQDSAFLFMRTPPSDPDDPYLTVLRPSYGETFAMNGPALLQYFSPRITREQILALAEPILTPEEIDFVLSHQASARMVDHVGTLKFPNARGYSRGIMEYGNTSSASILFDLEDSLTRGLIQQGDTVLTVGYGAGLTWGAAVIQIREKPSIAT